MEEAKRSVRDVWRRIWDGPEEPEEETPAALEKSLMQALPEQETENEMGVKRMQYEEPSYGAAYPAGNSETQETAYHTGTTVVSENTSLTGEINSENNVKMLGTMKGNITTSGDVKICGKMIGDIKGANVELISCSVQGNITATASVKMTGNSVLIGDIQAENLTINGRMKGNATLRNLFKGEQNALVIGNVIAAVSSVEKGAKIQGSIQIGGENMPDVKIDGAGNA